MLCTNSLRGERATVSFNSAILSSLQNCYLQTSLAAVFRNKMKNWADFA